MRFVCRPPRQFDLAQNHYAAGDRLYLRNHAIKGLAGDIARFVPELDPLVAGIVQSPVKRPRGGTLKPMKATAQPSRCPVTLRSPAGDGGVLFFCW